MSSLKKLFGKKEEEKTEVKKDPGLPARPKGICWSLPNQGMNIAEYIVKWMGYLKDKPEGVEQEPIHIRNDKTSLLLCDSDLDNVIKSKGFSKVRFTVCAVDEYGNESEYSECVEINLDRSAAPKLEVKY